METTCRKVTTITEEPVHSDCNGKYCTAIIYELMKTKIVGRVLTELTVDSSYYAFHTTSDQFIRPHCTFCERDNADMSVRITAIYEYEVKDVDKN
jgi:hypothetical protein